jgi:hypothetical protein
MTVWGSCVKAAAILHILDFNCGKRISTHADTHESGARYLPETFVYTATLMALLTWRGDKEPFSPYANMLEENVLSYLLNRISSFQRNWHSGALKDPRFQGHTNHPQDRMIT